MNPRAFIVVGLGFGDEGKGSLTDYLARRYGASLVVRYNGGAQAAHNVCLSDGCHHTFAQLGSASYTGAHTHLSSFMLVDLFALVKEISAFGDEALRRLTLDPRCLIIHPIHVILNRLRETVRTAKHGSCGMGIGECRRYQVEGKPVLYASDLKDHDTLMDKYYAIEDVAREEIKAIDLSDATARWLKDYFPMRKVLVETCFQIAKHLRYATDEEIQLRLRNRVTIFEGAQGVLLDEKYGFAPYNTWTNTTTENARAIIGDVVPITSVGVIRTFSTRHGPGPFVSENGGLNLDKYNTTGDWQGRLRIGHFDRVATRYAIKHAGGIDEIALTWLDDVQANVKVVESYLTTKGTYSEIDPPAARSLDTLDLMCAAPVLGTHQIGIGGPIALYQKFFDQPITYGSWGPTEKDKLTVCLP